MGVRHHALQGNIGAARKISVGEYANGINTNVAEVRADLMKKLKEEYNIAGEEALKILSTSEGTISTVKGTKNELRYEINIKGLLPDDKIVTLADTINNKGGINQSQTWTEGGIDVQSALTAFKQYEINN